MKDISIVSSNINRASIERTLKFVGKGLHSGKAVTFNVLPAKSGDGILFIRMDIKDKDNKIKLDFNMVTDLTFNTTIANNAGVEVSTVEHFLAALYAMQISDCIIEIDNKEAPIMDGSSLVFLNGLKTVSRNVFNEKMNLAVIKNEVFVGDEKSSITALPPLYDGQFCIDFEIDFECKEVGIQRFIFEPSKGDTFSSELSHAKTFALKKDYDYLLSIGYAKGGEESNGILLEEDKIHNPKYLTYKNDFIRHKILDFLGDLYISGHLFSGRFICKKSGHKLSNLLLKKLFNGG